MKKITNIKRKIIGILIILFGTFDIAMTIHQAQLQSIMNFSISNNISLALSAMFLSAIIILGYYILRKNK
jgi:hypothetical protein